MSSELNGALCRFIQQVKSEKKNEEFYEPGTYKKVSQSSKGISMKMDIVWRFTSSTKFQLFRDVVKAKMTMAKGAGRGNRPNRARAVSIGHTEKMLASLPLDSMNQTRCCCQLWAPDIVNLKT